MDVETRDLIEQKLREIYQECDKPLKSGWIKQREVGGGREEDYIDGAYVIKMLNHLFPCGWSKHIKAINILDESKNNRGNHVITAECHMVLKIHPWGDVLIEQEDVGSVEMFAPSRGGAMSNARKGAVTDALKRCAKSLGNSFGLALSMDPHACKAVGAVEPSKKNDPEAFGKRGTTKKFNKVVKPVVEDDEPVKVEAKKSRKYPWLSESLSDKMTRLYKEDKEKPIGTRLKSEIFDCCKAEVLKVMDTTEDDADELICDIFEEATDGNYNPPIGGLGGFMSKVDEILASHSHA